MLESQDKTTMPQIESNEFIPFEINLNKNKCAFFHLMGNFINSEVGNNFYNVKQFIYNNINDTLADTLAVDVIDKPKIMDELLILDLNDSILVDNQQNISIFYEENDVEHKLSLFDYDNYDFDIQKSFSYKEKINKPNLITWTQNRNIIFYLSFDKHATTIYIDIEKSTSKYNFFLFNSGKGIKNHENNKLMYKPYIMFSSYDINLISYIILFIYFYSSISNNVKIYSTIYKYLKNKFKTFDNFKLTSNADSKVELFEYTNFYILPKVSYYDIISSLFKYLEKINTDVMLVMDCSFKTIDSILIKKLKGKNIEQYIDNYNVLYGKYKHIIDVVKVNEENMFIYPQLSSSCTWYSIYWPILIHILIYYEPIKYYNTIINIFNKCIDIMNNIFTINNFEKEITINNSSIVTMNNLALKLINLNLINIKLRPINIFNYDIVYTENINKLKESSKFIKDINDYNSFFDLLTKICSNEISISQKHNTFFKNICIFIHKNYDNLISNINDTFPENWEFNILKYFNDSKNELKQFVNTFQKKSQLLDLLNEQKKLSIANNNKGLEDKLELLITILNNTSDIELLNDELLKINSIYINVNEINNMLKLFYSFTSNDTSLFYNQYYLYYLMKYYINNLSFDELIKYTKLLHKLIIVIHVINILKNKFNDMFKWKDILILIDEINDQLYEMNDKLHESNDQLQSTIIILTELRHDIYLNLKYLEINLKHHIIDQFIRKSIIIGPLINLCFNGLMSNSLENTLYNYNYVMPRILILNNEGLTDTTNIKNDMFKDFYEDVEITKEQINNEFELLKNNPSYIFNNYLYKYDFEQVSLLFKLNIKQFNYNTTEQDNILIFFLKNYIKGLQYNNVKNITLSLIHIQLLLYGCHSDIEIGDNKYFHSDLLIYNNYQEDIPLIKFETLDKILSKLYIINNENENDFIDFIIKNKNILTNFKEIISVYDKPNNFNSIISNTDIFFKLNLFIHKLLNLNEDTFIFHNKEQNKIIIININYYIILELSIANNITKIFYNNNEVLNYDEITEPFVNIIPINCFHFIYKINEQYHITYFVNNKLQIPFKENILNVIQSNIPIITIRISKENNFLPIGEDIQLFTLLLNNFGYNMLNYIYLKNFSNVGYIVSESEYKFVLSFKKFKFEDKVALDDIIEFPYFIKETYTEIDSPHEQLNHIFLNKNDKIFETPIFKLKKKITPITNIATSIKDIRQYNARLQLIRKLGNTNDKFKKKKKIIKSLLLNFININNL